MPWVELELVLEAAALMALLETALQWEEQETQLHQQAGQQQESEDLQQLLVEAAQLDKLGVERLLEAPVWAQEASEEALEQVLEAMPQDLGEAVQQETLELELVLEVQVLAKEVLQVEEGLQAQDSELVETLQELVEAARLEMPERVLPLEAQALVSEELEDQLAEQVLAKEEILLPLEEAAAFLIQLLELPLLGQVLVLEAAVLFLEVEEAAPVAILLLLVVQDPQPEVLLLRLEVLGQELEGPVEFSEAQEAVLVELEQVLEDQED